MRAARLPDWEDRFAGYLAARHDGTRFGYDHSGDPTQDDCCTFAAGAVEAITGDDPMPEFRGRYRSKTGSLRALKTVGAGTLEATLDGKFDRVEAAFAQRGDLVMTGTGLAVCIGADALQPGDGGPTRVSGPWLAAWAV